MYDLGRQISQRFRMWKEELKNHLYTPVGTVDFSFFTTTEHPDAAEAEKYPRVPCPAGTRWGAMWEYGWFFGDTILPEACEGRRVVLLSGVGGEQLVYGNGKALGSVDRKHPYVTLARNGKAGTSFRLQIESYAGHGPRLETLGPCPPERPAVPPAEGPQCTVGETVIAVWNEDAYQLYLDVEALDSLQQVLPDNSLRALKVAEALNDFTRIADFELPPAQRDESFREARKALHGALSCVNGSTAPVMWIFGQSHIDLGWLWPLEETRHKSVRTYANQLALMEEYPEYRFLLCEPALMEMLSERDEAVWSRVRKAYRKNQIEPEGAFYVECDTNIPSGESLIRQLLYGKKWFREQFGVDSRVAWQPDTFGFSAALPQILKKTGVDYFATEKLLRADPETQRFPYQNFIWEGMDGTCVEALSFFKANAPVSPQLLHKRWETERSQRRNIDTMLYSFGYGDGGGGADRDMLEMIRRCGDLEGAPRIKWGSLRGFFEETGRQARKNRWVGELYLAWHRGTYSVQRRQKTAMRRAEEAIRETEMLASALPEENRAAVAAQLDRAWKTLLLHQFHDIAGGVGIARVHREATETLEDLAGTLHSLNDSLWYKTRRIHPDDGVVLLNPLPWTRTGWVTLPGGEQVFAELKGGAAADVREARVPVESGRTVSAMETEEGFRLRNHLLDAVVDRQGRVVSLKAAGGSRDFLESGQVMNDWRLYRNVQTVYDAWELDRDWQDEQIRGAVLSRASLTKSTPDCAEITVEHIFGESSARQTIRLRPMEEQLTFETEVDWHERRKMLKVHFESNVLCQDAIHEIQFGYVKRPCHHSHPFAQDRYEVSNHRFSALAEENRGFAVLNDGLYGLSTDRGEIALTLLRAPLVPDDTCDRGKHRFTYALRPFCKPFDGAELARAGQELNVPVRMLQGRSPENPGCFSCGRQGVLPDTIKPADNGQGTILRLYEARGAASSCVLALPRHGTVYDSAMDENSPVFLASGTEVSLEMKPFEIRTLRVVFD